MLCTLRYSTCYFLSNFETLAFSCFFLGFRYYSLHFVFSLFHCEIQYQHETMKLLHDTSEILHLKLSDIFPKIIWVLEETIL